MTESHKITCNTCGKETPPLLAGCVALMAFVLLSLVLVACSPDGCHSSTPQIRVRARPAIVHQPR